MQKSLLLLLAGVLLVLISLAPASAQGFHRFGRANRSLTLKPTHTNKHVKHREKTKKVKKHRPDNGENRRHKQAKRAEIRRESDALDRQE